MSDTIDPSAGPASVHAAFIRVVLSATARLGLDVGAVMAAASLDAATLQDPDGRVGRASVVALWRHLVAVTADPAVGLQLAAQVTEKAMGAVEYAARNCPNLLEVYRSVLRHGRLVNRAVRLELVPEPGGVRLLYFDPGHTSLMRPATDFVMGYFLQRGRELTGVRLVPVEVGFTHSAPIDIRPYARFFGGQLRWRQATGSILFSQAQLALPVLDPDPDLAELMSHFAEAQLARMPVADDFLQEVRALLLRAGTRGFVQLDEVADQLGTSPRSLQRRLREHGTTFKRLAADVRMEVAAGLLADGRLAVGEVAFLTGFSDASAFHRAFKLVHGCTPLEFRAGQPGAPGTVPPMR
ncbi:MAG: AraC family transcriptional regulator [Myxococcales bacterium]|nr:AraC family transcriptional regulator [Myxococcales bacterium]